MVGVGGRGGDGGATVGVVFQTSDGGPGGDGGLPWGDGGAGILGQPGGIGGAAGKIFGLPGVNGPA
ncbi:PE-PGRS family protein [Mycobacterium bourgelatii]|nr:PE-PGRS family protein [Mycobacterium bourgelatii]